MMASKAAQVADAITAAINAATWSLDFRAERSYADFDDRLTDLERIKVDVVPKFDPQIELDTRATTGWELAVDVGVRKLFTQSDIDSTSGKIKLTALDQMVQLVEDLAQFLIEDRFTALNSIGAVWMETRIPALYIRDHLREWSQFTGYIRLVFSLHCEVPA
jgi:hypothetical protein